MLLLITLTMQASSTMQVPPGVWYLSTNWHPCRNTARGACWAQVADWPTWLSHISLLRGEHTLVWDTMLPVQQLCGYTVVTCMTGSIHGSHRGDVHDWKHTWLFALSTCVIGWWHVTCGSSYK